MMPLGVPTGPLRAPGSNALAFVFQSFIDELAHAAGKDPLQFRSTCSASRGAAVRATPLRRRSRASTPAACAACSKLVAEKSGWGKRQLPKGTGMGVAFYYSHLGYFAEVVQATVDRDGRGEGRQGLGRRRRRQPDHQPERRAEPGQGAVLDGIGEALGQEITIENGARGADQLPRLPAAAHEPGAAGRGALRHDHDNPPTGLGEPALPPVIPALCNAIFAATGKRIRTLPIDTTLLKAT